MTELFTKEKMQVFTGNLSSHDARHNLCGKCFHTIILVEGSWRHNRKGYVADHDAVVGSKLLSGARELFAGEEIIEDEYLKPTLTRDEFKRRLDRISPKEAPHGRA